MATIADGGPNNKSCTLYIMIRTNSKMALLIMNYNMVDSSYVYYQQHCWLPGGAPCACAGATPSIPKVWESVGRQLKPPDGPCQQILALK